MAKKTQVEILIHTPFTFTSGKGEKRHSRPGAIPLTKTSQTIGL